MTVIAPMSSTIASVSRNTRSDRRAAGAEQGEQRRGRTRCRWPSTMPQPRAAVAAGVDREVEQRGHDHPGQRGDGRDRGRAPVAQLAQRQLAPDLQPDDEEEEHHQAVVDPVAQVLADRGVAERRPPAPCSTGPRRRPTAASSPTPSASTRGGEQQRGAAGLRAEEVAAAAARRSRVHSVRRGRPRPRSPAPSANRSATARKKSARVTSPAHAAGVDDGTISTRWCRKISASCDVGEVRRRRRRARCSCACRRGSCAQAPRCSSASSSERGTKPA